MREVINLALLDEKVDEPLDLTIKPDVVTPSPVLN